MGEAMSRKESVLVVGGGTMGRGIAGACALAGYRTRVFESDASRRAALADEIRGSFSRAVRSGRLAAEAMELALARLETPAALEDSAPPDYVVEAVPEDLALKRRLFGKLDRLFPDAAFLATNTSALSIGEIARDVSDPARVLGLHFFNPVAAMPLVELVRGRDTGDTAFARAEAFVASLGKQAIRVTDAPGFATSRLGVALGLEAMRMVEEGVAAAADIDRAMELGYGHRMGPLKTSDLVGLDVRLAIAENLAAALDDRRFAPPAILRRLVAAGKTGRKSGEGFYRWEGDVATPAEGLA